MTQPSLDQRQREWRERVLQKACTREIEDCEKERTKKFGIKKKWSTCEEKAKKLYEALAHLNGMPVRYDGKPGKVAVTIEKKMEEEEETEVGQYYECWVVRLGVCHGGVSFIKYYGVRYLDAGIIVNNIGQPVSVEAAVEAAEQWVEEHAYGTAEEASK